MKENLLLLKYLLEHQKNKIDKYITSISKNVYIYKFDNIVNEYNNTYHSTIKMKPADVKLSTHVSFAVENNFKDTKFELAIK